jgi:hypothetical protein
VRVLAALVLVALAGCGPEKDGALTPAGERQCLARGGEVAALGPAAATSCMKPAADAGKSCSVGSDCSGFCDPDTFTCSADISRTGCYAFIDDLGEEQVVCAE